MKFWTEYRDGYRRGYNRAILRAKMQDPFVTYPNWRVMFVGTHLAGAFAAFCFAFAGWKFISHFAKK